LYFVFSPSVHYTFLSQRSRRALLWPKNSFDVGSFETSTSLLQYTRSSRQMNVVWHLAQPTYATRYLFIAFSLFTEAWSFKVPTAGSPWQFISLRIRHAVNSVHVRDTSELLGSPAAGNYCRPLVPGRHTNTHFRLIHRTEDVLFRTNLKAYHRKKWLSLSEEEQYNIYIYIIFSHVNQY